MYKTTLYEVVAHNVMAGTPTHIERMQMLGLPLLFCGHDPLVPIDDHVKVEKLQRHRIVRIDGQGQKHETFIAFSPEAEGLLRAPFEAEILLLSNRLADRNWEIMKVSSEHTTLTDRLNAFNALPWYKRIFRRP